MESCNFGHYESVKKALEGVGFKVDKIQKKGKKTVITIFREESGEITDPDKKRGNDNSRERING